MNNLLRHTDFEKRIFDFNKTAFTHTALEIFQFQYQHSPVYQRYVNTLGMLPGNVKKLREIPFLPIDFFKTEMVMTGNFIAETVFESSGTTGSTNSRHYIRDLKIYQESYLRTFVQFYGSPTDWCILALLPSYLERKNSSLVVMAHELIRRSHHPYSGFYLDQFQELGSLIQQLEKENQKTLLLGVTFALLDFASQFPMQLNHTVVMETGGMKGRRSEMTRAEVHQALKDAWKLEKVHSEYGMTELLSQAYSNGEGMFHCPAWMRILARDEDDPLMVNESAMLSKPGHITGIINVIDLANIHSCSFIATDDVCKLYSDGSFEVLGRMDNSDIRGCSLLAV